MKTKIIIEVESPDAKDTTVIEEAGKSEEDYKTEELIKFRTEYSKDLHKHIINSIKFFVDEDRLIEDIMESDYGVEDWTEFNDYGIKIKTEVSGDSSHD